MKHLNDDVLCAVDTETTGLDYRKHDIVQIAVIPLDGFYNPRKDVMPFIMKVKPRYPENWDPKAAAINRTNLADLLINGVDYYDSADMFDRWYTDVLKVPPNKRIQPLAHNWPFDRDFIREWLTFEGLPVYFSGHYRDTMAEAMYLNDRAEYHSEIYPNPKLSLRYLCTHHEVALEQAHDAVADAVAAGALHRRFLNITC